MKKKQLFELLQKQLFELLQELLHHLPKFQQQLQSLDVILIQSGVALFNLELLFQLLLYRRLIVECPSRLSFLVTIVEIVWLPVLVVMVEVVRIPLLVNTAHVELLLLLVVVVDVTRLHFHFLWLPILKLHILLTQIGIETPTRVNLFNLVLLFQLFPCRRLPLLVVVVEVIRPILLGWS